MYKHVAFSPAPVPLPPFNLFSMQVDIYQVFAREKMRDRGGEARAAIVGIERSLYIERIRHLIFGVRVKSLGEALKLRGFQLQESVMVRIGLVSTII